MEKYSTGHGEKTSLFFASGSQGPSAWANEPSLFEDVYCTIWIGAQAMAVLWVYKSFNSKRAIVLL